MCVGYKWEFLIKGRIVEHAMLAWLGSGNVGCEIIDWKVGLRLLEGKTSLKIVSGSLERGMCTS